MSFVCPDCGGSDERVIDSEWRLHICPMPSRLNRKNVIRWAVEFVVWGAIVIYVMYLTFPWFLA